MPERDEKTERDEINAPPASAASEPEATTRLYFGFFNEIGIIEQLTTALLEQRLPGGLLRPHFSVLNHLVRVGDGRTPLSMAQAFQVPKTTMTHRVRVLERHGLVRVGPNEEDGRSKLVWLTAEGRAMREATIADFASLTRGWHDAIPPAEIADLLPRMERIRAYLDRARDEG